MVETDTLSRVKVQIASAYFVFWVSGLKKKVTLFVIKNGYSGCVDNFSYTHVRTFVSGKWAHETFMKVNGYSLEIVGCLPNIRISGG